MPKRKDRKMKARERAHYCVDRNDEGSDADDVCSEANSEMSYASTGHLLDIGEQDSAMADDDRTAPAWEESIENLSHKNPSVRAAALRVIHKRLLAGGADHGALNDRKLTLCDGMERCFKKGNDVEMILVSKLAVLLALHLVSAACGALSKLLAMMKQTAVDDGESAEVRNHCIMAMTVVTFAVVEEPDEARSVIDALHGLWARSKVRNAGSVFCSALCGWSFLMVQVTDKVGDVSNELIKLRPFLDSPLLDVRIATGEAVGLLYELGWEIQGAQYKAPIHEDLTNALQRMSTESVKYRGKKDRRTQRASFRDICKAVNDGSFPEFKVKLGAGDALIIDSWRMKISYDVMCSALRGGMDGYLKRNAFVREMFFRDGSAADSVSPKTSKLERKSLHSMICKERKQMRSKQRDVRFVKSTVEEF